MSDVELDQGVKLAFLLTIAEQTKLLERIPAHLACEVESASVSVTVESLADRTFELWSPQDEGSAIAALNLALNEHRDQKRVQIQNVG